MKCSERVRLIPLTQGKFAVVDEDDYEIVRRFPWYCQRTKRTNYAMCKMYIGSLGGKSQSVYMSLHRLIMRPPHVMDIDHKDHNGLNCRRSNMRICTRTENARGRRICTDIRRKTSVYKGVSWNKRICKWHARICVKRKDIHLGYYLYETEAAYAYDEAAIKYFGEYAILNFPKREYLCEIKSPL